MDGNGRWAQARGKDRTAGHQEGLVAARSVVAHCARRGIRYLSLFVFSTENWTRARQETGFLMDLLARNLRKEYDFYRKEGIRLLHSGDPEGLPPGVRTELAMALEDTASHKGLTVNLAINYGGRDEILRAIRRMGKAGADLTTLDSQGLSPWLDNPELPDVDLLIRTGGERRISNFLLWRCAYAELHFSPVLWPDWSEGDLESALSDYGNRHRRFGGTQ